MSYLNQQRREARARLEWFDAYITTFLERDLPALGLTGWA